MTLSQTSLIKLLGISVAITNLLSLSSCASMPPPREEISKAELTVNEAQAAKASQYAPAELRKARKKLEAAKQAMTKGHYPEAHRLAEQALVDAQLAEAKAHAEIQRQNVEEMRKSIEALRRELRNRTGS